MVSAARVIAIVSPSSAPVRRLCDDAKASGLLVDATRGRKTRAVIVTDSRHVIISALQPETISSRFAGEVSDDE